MLELFAKNLLPIFLAAGAGYLLAATLQVDPRPLARVGFFVFSPCLVFNIMVNTALPTAAVLRMGAFSLLSLLSLASVVMLVARWRRYSRPLTAALVLVVLIPNSGNYGLSAVLFAFGEQALAQASIFFVITAVLTFTVGVFIASLGRVRFIEALLGLLKVPTIWAVVLALLLMRAGWALPFPLLRTVELLAQACIPVFLVILGMQLYGKNLAGRFKLVLLASGMRLIGGFVWGFLLAAIFRFEGPALQAAVLESAMPSAVICTILATEYDVEPTFVTSVVCLTTLLSPFALTPILALLGA